ncbi:MAG: hypothetical protein JST80_06935 [Bdellovibrionales bacterium]|nr:hypothetical protein [Bdellovibrionales bacterium]
MNGLEQGWIYELARAEASPEADALYRLNQTTAPQQAIEESTVEFLTDLRAYFQEYVRVFNAQSDAGKKYPEIKIFNLTQGAADFMLYRNGIKLIIANTTHGVIQISYDKHIIAGAVPTELSIPQAEEILAQFGAFSTVNWIYRSEKVFSEQVAKHFFAEFARVSREPKKTKPNQKVLLEQIKALLQEQGMSLD